MLGVGWFEAEGFAFGAHGVVEMSEKASWKHRNTRGKVLFFVAMYLTGVMDCEEACRKSGMHLADFFGLCNYVRNWKGLTRELRR